MGGRVVLPEEAGKGWRLRWEAQAALKWGRRPGLLLAVDRIPQPYRALRRYCPPGLELWIG